MSMMGWVGSGKNFRVTGCVQKFLDGFKKWTHIQLCTKVLPEINSFRKRLMVFAK